MGHGQCMAFTDQWRALQCCCCLCSGCGFPCASQAGGKWKWWVRPWPSGRSTTIHYYYCLLSILGGGGSRPKEKYVSTRSNQQRKVLATAKMTLWFREIRHFFIWFNGMWTGWSKSQIALSDQIYWNMKTYVVLVLSKFYYYFGLVHFSLVHFMKHKNLISEEWPFHTFLKVVIFFRHYKKKCTIVHIIIIIIVFL